MRWEGLSRSVRVLRANTDDGSGKEKGKNLTELRSLGTLGRACPGPHWV